MSERHRHLASPTEERNPRTRDLDRLPTLALLERLNDEDAQVAAAVRRALPAVAALVEIAVASLGHGHRVHYVGAGSSGRMAVLDAAELPPTFGIPPDRVVAHLAGGEAAVRWAVEGAEDDEAAGARDLQRLLDAGDLVIGLAASGSTTYVGGALRAARAADAHTGLITSNPSAPLAGLADVVVVTETGPEAVTGSTRLKAATAQKLVLNAFSTAVMVRTGRTWSNLMVDVRPTNAKLRGRVTRLLQQASDQPPDRCQAALHEAGGDTKTALVMLLADTDADAARAALDRSGGSVAVALRSVR